MIDVTHRDFLSKYSKPDDHYSYEDAPHAYLYHRGMNITPEQLDRTMEEGSWGTQAAVLRHPLSTRDHVDIGLKSRDYFVRRAALEHPTITDEDLIRARHDAHSSVRDRAAELLKARGSEYGL